MSGTDTTSWFQTAKDLVSKLETSQASEIDAAADLIFDRLQIGGRLFVFGSGHSAILVEEIFHRAGGLVPVVPVLASFLTPHLRPSISGKLEKLEGIGSILFQTSGVDPKCDLFLAASNSGVNAAVVEVGLACYQSKIPLIVFTSLAHSVGVTSKHSSGKKLFELATVVLNNCCPEGDALVEVSSGTKVAAGSTFANVFLWNAILVRLANKFATQANSKRLPFYKSANIPGGLEHNQALEGLYEGKLNL